MSHGRYVTSVQREGHRGIENGELLARLEGHFDIFILADKNLRYQQNLRDRTIATIELPTNRRTDGLFSNPFASKSSMPYLLQCRDHIQSLIDPQRPDSSSGSS